MRDGRAGTERFRLARFARIWGTGDVVRHTGERLVDFRRVGLEELHGILAPRAHVVAVRRVADESDARVVERLRDTLTRPDHLRAFALVSVLMIGAFAVIPFISASYVANVGVSEAELPLVFVAGGLLTLVGSPVIGRLADR